MSSDHADAVYSVGLLRKVAAWSVPMAFAAALFGTGITRDLRFGASCLIGAAFDVGTLYWALDRTKSVDPHEALASGPLAYFFVFRLVVKSLLLVVATVMTQWLDVLGMAAGVLVVDFTLATAGSASAAWHMFRPHRPSG
jgi:hypothetical protein